MAVSTGDTITAAQYNGLQSRVNTIMGTGSSTNGYGQSLTSGQVSVGQQITATHFDSLRTDINKANNHQSGSNAAIGDIAVGQVIGADASGTSVSALTVTNEGFNDYETAVGVIETNKFLIDGGNSSVEAATSSTRSTAWGGGGGGVVNHVFTVTFASANARRYFFNSGGEIRFSASLSGSSGSKYNDWRTMLINMGTIKFGYTATTATGTGTTTSIGNYDLTGTYQTIFRKNGTGVYAENEYEIQARADSSTILRFNVRFEDNDLGDQQPVGPQGIDPNPAGPAIDENVTGTLVSTIQQLRATGSNVSVASPSYTNTSNL